jgi:hypothetical protein
MQPIANTAQTPATPSALMPSAFPLREAPEDIRAHPPSRALTAATIPRRAAMSERKTAPLVPATVGPRRVWRRVLPSAAAPHDEQNLAAGDIGCLQCRQQE